MEAQDLAIREESVGPEHMRHPRADDKAGRGADHALRLADAPVAVATIDEEDLGAGMGMPDEAALGGATALADPARPHRDGQRLTA